MDWLINRLRRPQAEEPPEYIAAVRGRAVAGAQRIRRTDHALIDTLKTLLDDFDLSSVTATRRTEGGNWRTVTVREPGALDPDAIDGFVTVVEDHSL
jgi:hypothetical protein